MMNLKVVSMRLSKEEKLQCGHQFRYEYLSNSSLQCKTCKERECRFDNANMHNYQEEVQKLKTELNKNLKNSKTLQNRLTEKEKCLKKAKDQLAKSGDNNGKLNAQLNECKKTICRLGTENNELEKCIKELKKQLNAKATIVECLTEAEQTEVNTKDSTKLSKSKEIPNSDMSLKNGNAQQELHSNTTRELQKLQHECKHNFELLRNVNAQLELSNKNITILQEQANDNVKAIECLKAENMFLALNLNKTSEQQTEFNNIEKKLEFSINSIKDICLKNTNNLQDQLLESEKTQLTEFNKHALELQERLKSMEEIILKQRQQQQAKDTVDFIAQEEAEKQQLYEDLQHIDDRFAEFRKLVLNRK